MLIHSTFTDFILFLYVHMSQADSSYDPHELAAIKTKMKTLFPDGTDLERKLYTAIREYNAFDKARLNQLIEGTLDHFSESVAAAKGNVYTDLYEIVQADGKVDQSETKALEALKKLIDHQST